MNTIKNQYYTNLKCPYCGSITFINRCFALVDETVYLIERQCWTTPGIFSTKDRPEIKCTLDIPGKDAFTDPELYALIEEGYDLSPIRCAQCDKGRWKSIEQLKEEQLKEEQK